MDVRLYHTIDGGEIESVNGQITMAEGLESAGYLSLFGGNYDDSGSDADEPLEWWGNKLEEDDAKKLRSRTQAILCGLPATPANLQLVDDAMAADLAWMLEEVATSVDVAARLVAPKRVELSVEIAVGESRYPFTIPTDWIAT